jgi:hypothetical protein
MAERRTVVGKEYPENSMNEQAALADITFTEHGHADVAQLNALYRLIGWGGKSWEISKL